MNAEENSEESIFDVAVQLSTREERVAYLKDACLGDPALCRRVEDLLKAHEEAGEFLDTPVVSDALKSSPVSAKPALGPNGTTIGTVTERSGDRIGRYKLLQVIGEGGCGVVYMAEQEEPVRRRVALKIIKMGMDTKSVVARFEVERQALAMMDHPNIAKVLDAGATLTGRPYFVMELVRGIRVTEYCDQNNLPTEDRLKLFIQVCRAIQHAHQKGVIHRDIKPSNILVTLHDGVAVPKVIDFGIAKATDQRLTDKTLFTEFQSFIGTPAYVSPEQAEMSGLDMDTRSDIYSLGVLLYELLTGKTPFDPDQLMRAGLDDMRRTIRETEPPRPSTRLGTMLHAELTATAKRQQSEPPKLVSIIRGDLDWIVMKCLEKDRTRRYETTALLAMDIERYLNQEPVFAHAPSKLYLLQKMMRRNKATFVGGAAVTVALIAGLITSMWLFLRERDARKDAVVAVKEQAHLRSEAEQARANETQQHERAEAERRTALRTAYNSDMNLIPQAMAANNFGRVINLLNRHRPKGKSETPSSASGSEQDLRQWEWRYFWNQFQSDAAFSLPRQSNAVSSVAISPDGRFLASSSSGMPGMPGMLKLWDLFRRAEAATFQLEGPGSAFAFSPKGDRLAATFNEGRRRTIVKVLALPGREITAVFPHDGGVQSLAFSPDGAKLLTIGQDLAVRVWDFGTKQLTLQTQVKRQGEGFWRAEALFSPDARRLAIGDESGRIRIIDVATGAETGSVAAFEGAIAAMAFSPDGGFLAATAFVTETNIKLFSTQTGVEEGQLVGHASWVKGVTFSSNGNRLVSAGADQTIRIWDIPERRELAALRGHMSEVNCVAVTSDAKTIVSGCKDGTLFGWDAERIEHKKPFDTLPIPIASIEFFPGGQAMLSVNGDGTVSLWDLGTLHESERISALGNRVTRLLVSTDGVRLYAGTQDGEIKVLDWATRLIITNLAGFQGRGFPNTGRFPGGGSPSGPVGLADDGRTLIAASAGSTVRLWDTASWQQKASWKVAEGGPLRASQIILSPDQRFLLVAGFGGTIDFRNLANGQPEATLVGQNSGIWGITFSPDGSLLATASWEGTVTLWNVSERKEIDVLRGHLLGVHAVAFSPDAQRLASGSVGQEAVKLWDVLTHQEVATLAGQGSIFQTVKFSPGGRMLVAINAQRTAHIWRAPSVAEIAAAESKDSPVVESH